MSNLPWMPELGKLAVVVEGVVTLVGQGGAVVGDLLLPREYVQVGVAGALDPVVRPDLGVQLPGQDMLSDPIEQGHKGSLFNVSLGEESFTSLGPTIIIIVNNYNITATFFYQNRKSFIRCFIYLIAAFLP